ncbi:MAG: hypothetical protein RIG62_28020 [Cyclobacteriaceae bacterium]
MNTDNFSTEAIPTLEKDAQTTVANTQILVFRSNINSPAKAALVLDELRTMKGIFEVNVDLHDWENILRVACHPTFRAHEVEEKLTHLGFLCDELAD